MQEMDAYRLWCKTALEDDELSAELAAIAADTDEIKDRFYRDLEFGTGGLRGIIGAGTNRMNIYTVRKATQGLANDLLERENAASVAISYDSRIKSDLFAREAARVLAANGIQVYLYPTLMPTPCLSFAVRELHCDAGIMITASHNPAKYNGYKTYGPDGCQMTDAAAGRVLAQIQKVDLFRGVELIGFEQAVADGTIEYISPEVNEKFYRSVLAQSLDAEACKKAGLKVVYTPLNGTGNIPVREILSRLGAEVSVVSEQEKPDGTFSTCPYPNPEIPEALALGLACCEKEMPDLLLATDPDCDRAGIAVPDTNGQYVLITGNEVGALLTEYICRTRTARGTMPEHPVLIKTIVTTELAARIAEDYGAEVIDVLTGFKYIGEQIGRLEEKGEAGRFIFGFEESYGYLAGSYVRDKDAVLAAMLICEMAASAKLEGRSILEELQALYKKYGVYLHRQQSFTCEGAAGMEQMKRIMENLRENPPEKLAGQAVLHRNDYLTQVSLELPGNTESKIDLPKSNVLSYFLENGASVVLRPSGTEPKIKAYYTVVGADMAEAEQFLELLKNDFTKLLGF